MTVDRYAQSGEWIRVTDGGRRPTGQEIFDSLSKAEQDEMLGPEAADMVRNGDAVLADFVEVDGGFITQKPVAALEGKAAQREYVRDRLGQFAETAGDDDKPKVPKWKRNRKYNGWVRSLSPTEQEALARQFYDRLWSQLQAYYGAVGQPPPEMIFTAAIPAGAAAAVFADENGIRQVQLNPSQILKLALRGDRSEAIRVITHEWRHVFQNANLFWVGRDQPHDAQPIEQDANGLAQRILQTMKRNRRRKQQGKPLIRPVPYNPQNMSENIGKDPTTIPYPT